MIGGGCRQGDNAPTVAGSRYRQSVMPFQQRKSEKKETAW